MSTTVIAGKPSNTVGEKDSTLVLRGSSIKILWGNKFIDLIKNGKINVESEKILKTTDSVENITSDGIYLVDGSIWAVIGGTKIQLAGDSTTTYVSYLVELETTSELKQRALTNIGFYYDTFELAQNAGLTSGIIYVLGDNKLYAVRDGVLTEYTSTSDIVNNEEVTMEKLYISEYSLVADGEEYITCDSNSITAHKQLVLENGLISEGATSFYGYRLYTRNGLSYLEVDNLVVRNTTPDRVSIYPDKYYLEENIILSAIDNSDDSGILLTLLYSDKYEVGDILTTSILVDSEIDDETITELILVPIDFIIESINNNTYTVSTESNYISTNTIPYLINKSIFYKKGNLPVARLQDHNYDLFGPNVELIDSNISTRIGSILELTISGEKISGYTENNLGIYSNNAFLENSYLFNTKLYNTKLYNTEFTAVKKDGEYPEDPEEYPKYADGWEIPEDSDDLTIASTLWVLDRLDPIREDITNIWNALDEKADAEEDDDSQTDDISNLLLLIDDLKAIINVLLYGDDSNPVVLASGVIEGNSINDWSFVGTAKDVISEITVTRIDGLWTILLNSERTISVQGVVANLEHSPETLSTSTTEIKDSRGRGSHWFETKCVGSRVHIREFHLANDDNDSWTTGDYDWGSSVRSISVIITGYIE